MRRASLCWASVVRVASARGGRTRALGRRLCGASLGLGLGLGVGLGGPSEAAAGLGEILEYRVDVDLREDPAKVELMLLLALPEAHTRELSLPMRGIEATELRAYDAGEQPVAIRWDDFAGGRLLLETPEPDADGLRRLGIELRRRHWLARTEGWEKVTRLRWVDDLDLKVRSFAATVRLPREGVPPPNDRRCVEEEEEDAFVCTWSGERARALTIHHETGDARWRWATIGLAIGLGILALAAAVAAWRWPTEFGRLLKEGPERPGRRSLTWGERGRLLLRVLLAALLVAAAAAASVRYMGAETEFPEVNAVIAAAGTAVIAAATFWRPDLPRYGWTIPLLLIAAFDYGAILRAGAGESIFPGAGGIVAILFAAIVDSMREPRVDRLRDLAEVEYRGLR